MSQVQIISMLVAYILGLLTAMIVSAPKYVR